MPAPPVQSKADGSGANVIHPTAEVSDRAIIGPGTSIWHHAQVREGARLGQGCIVGKGAYVDAGVQIGDNCKIQNYVSLYQGVILEDGVFCGPHTVFTNDKRPRAVNPDGSLKSAADWTVTPTRVGRGAAIGANATILCGITIGRWAMIGAGSVVTADVPDYGLVWGNPARLHGFVCPCGERLWNPAAVPGWNPAAVLGWNPAAVPGATPPDALVLQDQTIRIYCQGCGAGIPIPAEFYQRVIDEQRQRTQGS